MFTTSAAYVRQASAIVADVALSQSEAAARMAYLRERLAQSEAARATLLTDHYAYAEMVDAADRDNAPESGYVTARDADTRDAWVMRWEEWEDSLPDPTDYPCGCGWNLCGECMQVY